MGREDLACFFLQCGASAEKPCADYKWGVETCATDQPLHVAIKCGMQELSALLVKKGAIKTDEGDTMGSNALHLCLRYRYLLLAKQIASSALGAGKSSIHDDVEKVTGAPSLLLALRCDEVELACHLLDCGADPNSQDSDGRCALHVIARKKPSFRTQFELRLADTLLQMEPMRRNVQSRMGRRRSIMLRALSSSLTPSLSSYCARYSISARWDPRERGG